MSQTGLILSVASQSSGMSNTNDVANWIVLFSYALDAGGTATAEVKVGAGASAVVGLWASPTATVAIPLSSTPGTTNQVLLPCPDIVKCNAFRLQKGCGDVAYS